jgi:hypothetical protein
MTSAGPSGASTTPLFDPSTCSFANFNDAALESASTTVGVGASPVQNVESIIVLDVTLDFRTCNDELAFSSIWLVGSFVAT